MRFILALIVLSAVLCCAKSEQPIDGQDDIIDYGTREENKPFEMDEFLAKRELSRKMKGCLNCVSSERSRGTNLKFITQACSQVCKRNIFDSRSYDDGEQEDEKFNYPSSVFGF